MFAVQGLVFAAIAAVIVAVYAVLYWRAAPHLVALPPRYLTRNPSELPPAMVGMLFDPAMTPDKLAATLLDLVRRGVIEMSPVPPSVSDSSSDRRSREAARRLHLRRDKLGGLRPFETEVVNQLFDHVGGGGDDVWLGQLRGWWAANPATACVVEEIIAVRLHQELVTEGLVDPRAGRTKTLLTLFSYAVCSGVLFGVVLGAWVVLFLALAAILLTWTQRLPVVTAQGAKVAARYESFRRYLADYGRFKDRSADAVILWGEYLPMAIVLGVADEAEREMTLGRPAAELGEGGLTELPDERQAVEYLTRRRLDDLTLPELKIVHGQRAVQLRFSGDVQPAASVSGPLGKITLAARRRPLAAFAAVSPLILLPVLIVIVAGILQLVLR